MFKLVAALLFLLLLCTWLTSWHEQEESVEYFIHKAASELDKIDESNEQVGQITSSAPLITSAPNFPIHSAGDPLPGLSPRERIVAASGDKMSRDALQWVSKMNAIGDKKIAFYCFLMISVSPGNTTFKDHSAHLIVSVDYAKKRQHDIIYGRDVLTSPPTILSAVLPLDSGSTKIVEQRESAFEMCITPHIGTGDPASNSAQVMDSSTFPLLMVVVCDKSNIDLERRESSNSLHGAFDSLAFNFNAYWKPIGDVIVDQSHGESACKTQVTALKSARSFIRRAESLLARRDAHGTRNRQEQDALRLHPELSSIRRRAEALEARANYRDVIQKLPDQHPD